jgi:hypothetical protein
MDSKLVVRSSRSSCRSLEGEIGLVKGVNEGILEESDGTPKRGGHGRRRRFKASSIEKWEKKENPLEVTREKIVWNVCVT